jgi:DNA-methyltransferase (dcm)
MEKPTAVGLFCGCGGFDLGFEQAGFNVALASDNWEPAVETYRENFDTPVLNEDASELSTEELLEEINTDIDVVIGGPPCQGFSQLNNRELEHSGFEKDERNTLFEDFLRLAAACDPEYIVMENVRALINRQTSDGDYVKDNIVEAFEQYDYECEYEVLRAEEYGVPQKRRRIFFVGSKDGSPVFPEKTHTESFETAGDALEGASEDLPNMYFANTSERVLEKIRHVPQGGYYKHLPDEYKTKDEDGNIVKRYGSYLRRVDPDEPALTVNSNEFIHPTKDRYLTPREMAMLQTFPDDFVFCGNKGDVLQQIGNAVPVELARVFAERLAEELE